VLAHSEKEQAAATFKATFGYHPILAFCDNSGEFLAGLLRPGNAGTNTAADPITVLDQALAQIPDPILHGSPLLVRADGAGCTKAFLAHIRALRERHVAAELDKTRPKTNRTHDQVSARAAMTVPVTQRAAVLDTGNELRRQRLSGRSLKLIAAGFGWRLRGWSDRREARQDG
jgi:Transposase DDE domain group 1